ncbi:MAG: hypothetical protein R2722_10410 [Tessaracoccus sp.]
MTEIPTPADLAPRFGRGKPVSPPRRRPQPAPTGWTDELALPISDRHFYLDTGIFHSLAGVDEEVRGTLLTYVDQHEHNDTIRTEVLTQRSEPLYTLRLDVLKLAQGCERRACRLPEGLNSVETIRNELIADAQLRHPDGGPSSNRRDHGGEAELIHLAERHEPKGALACNDAGASAVAKKHAVESFHFAHIVRAAVADGLSAADGLAAVTDGLKVSKLAAAEKSRTCNQNWLTGQSTSSS